ncbi:MAG: hypothetical protein M3198_15115 [Actinomycetota bacterium]|nr:hypothetical protein [Actinomycetota bacterium]
MTRQERVKRVQLVSTEDEANRLMSQGWDLLSVVGTGFNSPPVRFVMVQYAKTVLRPDEVAAEDRL